MIEDVINIKKILHSYKDETRALQTKRFFKTAPGEYSEGDIFLGVSVPIIRKIAKQTINIELKTIKELLYSPFHEERFLSLVFLTNRFNNKNKDYKEQVFNFYLKHIDQVNNWDLVDTSAHIIIGAYLYNNKNHLNLLIELSHSSNLWHRRIAIIATYYFIKKDIYDVTLTIATILRNDKQDLIQKAVGWMLREIGSRNLEIEKSFLDKYAVNMPRTMLLYAIEKFDEDLRKYYMQKKSMSIA